MAKVTSKLQVTLPKALAQRYGIEPGSEIEWEAAGETIRVHPIGARSDADGIEERLRLFDQARERQRRRERARQRRKPASKRPAGDRPRERGWKREDLYKRGRSR
jgi:bifunctional DNA-binding transcriptional regulator/antitoxin component of YhaV-PrlF toxin-antitoxin module